jgi:ArsR family transcriptional regulator
LVLIIKFFKMKFRNKSKYLQDDLKIARLARAMGHPARIAILKQLSSEDSCCFNELAGLLPLAESTVSQHLSELKKAGLIISSPMPPRNSYSINRSEWKTARRSFKELTRKMTGKKAKSK